MPNDKIKKSLSVIFTKKCALFLTKILILVPIASIAEIEIDKEAYKDAEEVRASFLHLESNDSIYNKLSQCLENHADFLGMGECYNDAYKAYDVLLNKIYKLALSSINSTSQNSLQASQQKWLEFRSEELKLYTQDWGYNPGSVIRIAIPRHKVEMIRERIAELTLYAHFEEQ